MCSKKSRGAASRAPASVPADVKLRPPARASAAIAVIPAPAPAPTAPGRRTRPTAAVTAARRARSTPPTAAAAPAPAAPLWCGPPAVTIFSPAAPAPAPRAPLGLTHRRRRAVAAIARRECDTVAAVTAHRIALAHRRRVGTPPRGQRAIGDAEPRAYAAHRRVCAGPVPEGHLEAGARAHPVDKEVA